jgi:methyl-accepting chemotaxis protein
VAIMPYYQPDSSDADAKPVAAIRLEYSLDKQLDQVEQHILISAIMLSAIFSGVLLMTLSITRKHIVLRLQKLRQAIDDVADFDDVSTRLPIVHNDEIDQLNESFNQLMEHLSVTSSDNK